MFQEEKIIHSRNKNSNHCQTFSGGSYLACECSHHLNAFTQPLNVSKNGLPISQRSKKPVPGQMPWCLSVMPVLG